MRSLLPSDSVNIGDAQRLRDQIRGWAVLPEIRDPAPLHEARRSIELDMVRPLVLGMVLTC